MYGPISLYLCPFAGTLTLCRATYPSLTGDSGVELRKRYLHHTSRQLLGFTPDLIGTECVFP